MPLPVGVHLTVICLLNCSLQNVKLTLCSTGLDCQMPLPGGYICICNFEMSSWPDIVLLLAFLMCNFVVATKHYRITTRTTKKDWVIYNWTENGCWLIFLFFFLLCFMYYFAAVATTQLHSNMCLLHHFVVVATTQLHSNNNHSNTKINVHKLLNFQSLISGLMFLLSLLLLSPCNYIVLAIIHLSLCIHNYRWTRTKLHSNNNNNNKKDQST